LAASSEDRPSVPKGWVLVEGDVGVDVKACFRRWDEGREGTEELMAGRVRGRGEGRRVPVDSCIAACKGV